MKNETDCRDDCKTMQKAKAEAFYKAPSAMDCDTSANVASAALFHRAMVEE